MKELKDIIYDRICAYCNDTIGYTLYTKDGDIINDYNPVCKPNTSIKESHGICETCLPEVYRQNGLDLEYLMMKKNKENKGE